MWSHGLPPIRKAASSSRQWGSFPRAWAHWAAHNNQDHVLYPVTTNLGTQSNLGTQYHFLPPSSGAPKLLFGASIGASRCVISLARSGQRESVHACGHRKSVLCPQIPCCRFPYGFVSTGGGTPSMVTSGCPSVLSQTMANSDAYGAPAFRSSSPASVPSS